jgi:carbonic anhydrase
VGNGGTVEIEESGTARLHEAQAGPPVRGNSRSALRGGFAPWRSWQGDGVAETAGAAGERIPAPVRSVLNGVDSYHRRHAHLLRPHVQELSTFQDPDTLFITCADSRLVPNLITSSGPGDLFTVRNVGNVVGSESLDPSVEAALDFALDELSIKSVVICGHSGCGAMTALLAGAGPAEAADRSPVEAWLEHGRPSLAAVRAGHPVQAAAAEAGYGAVDQLAMVNVAVQLELLQRHAGLAKALLADQVHVTGLFYDIATARVLQITPSGISHLDPLPGNADAGTGAEPDTKGGAPLPEPAAAR